MSFNVLYLAAGNAVLHTDFAVTYNDLLIDRDLKCDMLSVDLEPFDILIATPPCNYYSRANCNIFSSYSQSTKHLLPDILTKFIDSGKPFIIENVINKKRMHFILTWLPHSVKYVEHGRHCYFTNILDFDPSPVPQVQDFRYGGYFINSNDDRQGGSNVNNVFDFFLFEYF